MKLVYILALGHNSQRQFPNFFYYQLIFITLCTNNVVDIDHVQHHLRIEDATK